MRKIFIVLTAFAFVMAMGLPAMADETVTIDKKINIFVDQDISPTNSAEVASVKTDINETNSLTETDPINSTAVIDAAAVDGSAGIININQSPGNMNNQGNNVSVAYTSDGDAFLHSSATVSKANTGNSVSSEFSTRDNTIDGALNTVTGILGVNQSAGSMNNQDNAASMAIGLNAVAALCDADLTLTNSGNSSLETNVDKTDTITNGLVGVAGIIGVNQSSGCMNNQANNVAVCVSAASVSSL